jgi:hypothetical protein
LSGGDAAHPATEEVVKGKKSKGKKAGGEPVASGDLQDFCVEYAKSNRAKCVVCTETLQKARSSVPKATHLREDTEIVK